MASRKIPLITGEYYHIYNRGLSQLVPFKNKREVLSFSRALIYYTQFKPPRRFSFEKKFKDKTLRYEERLVSILAYCVMPNHFHLLLKQEMDDGISIYLQRLTLSFVRYYNVLHKRKGPVFESKFKAVRIESENQLLHVSRYIHLNPSSAGIVDDPLAYPYSTFIYYVHGGEQTPLAFGDILRGRSRESYKSFVYDNMEYQRTLQFVKHQLFDYERQDCIPGM